MALVIQPFDILRSSAVFSLCANRIAFERRRVNGQKHPQDAECHANEVE
jgi:hypothetical protein